MRMLFVCVLVASTVACSELRAASPTAPSSSAPSVQATDALVHPDPHGPQKPTYTPLPDAPKPAPMPTSGVTEIAPCSVLQPPAPGMAKLLLCVTYEDGIEAAGGADVIYNGVKQGITDPNGQFLLRIGGYGGTANLSIEYPVYSNSPYRIALPLREEVTTWSVDLGHELR